MSMLSFWRILVSCLGPIAILRQVSSMKGASEPLRTMFGRKLYKNENASCQRKCIKGTYRSMTKLSVLHRSLSIPPTFLIASSPRSAAVLTAS